jgi:hypothetical protein
MTTEDRETIAMHEKAPNKRPGSPFHPTIRHDIMNSSQPFFNLFTAHRRSGQPAAGSPSCRPCCIGPWAGERGCGDLLGSGHYECLSVIPSISPLLLRHYSLEEYIPDNLAVDGAGDAVLELEVHLGDGVFGEDGSIRDIT